MADEEFLIRTKGGPFDGEVRVVPRGVIPWPPPVNLPGVFHGGFYCLTTFSKLSEPTPGVMRGADYEWRPQR